MSTLLTQHGLDSLSYEERLALAEALWESLPEVEDEPLTDPVLIAELERRVALSRADPSLAVPWEDVLAAARARWGR